MKDEIIYFELNDWSEEVDYPNEEPFLKWIKEDENYLINNDWCKEQKICVLYFVYDMSISYLITAKKRWIEENCPMLLTKHKDYIVSGKNPCSRYNSRIKFLEYKPKFFGSREELK